MIVVDTNIISYLWLPSAFTEQAENLLQKDSHWIAPFLWRSEFRSVLKGYLKEGGLSLDQAIHLMEQVETQFSNKEYFVASSKVLKHSIDSGCSSYDCEFVVLAEDRKVPLVTHDKQVLKAFPKIAKSLDDF